MSEERKSRKLSWGEGLGRMMLTGAFLLESGFVPHQQVQHPAPERQQVIVYSGVRQEHLPESDPSYENELIARAKQVVVMTSASTASWQSGSSWPDDKFVLRVVDEQSIPDWIVNPYHTPAMKVVYVQEVDQANNDEAM